MKQKILLEAKKMAKEAGFHDAKRIGEWNGYEVVEPIFTDGEVHFTGLPQYILCKDGKLRWTSEVNECFAIFDSFNFNNK